MANHFSALKRARQTIRRSERNRANRSRLRSALRDLRESLAKGDKSAAEQVFRQTVAALDKAIQKDPRKYRVEIQVPLERARQRAEVT